ncbi:MAG: hypothetical protein IKZ84_07050 [Victivallales bacterium]|nr:hypothetical protein [Victivallales bacterium]
MRKAFAEYKKSVKEENSREIAANMLKKHFSMASIEECTRLPLDQILQIAKANNIQLP